MRTPLLRFSAAVSLPVILLLFSVLHDAQAQTVPAVGAYVPATNTLGFSTNTTLRMVINSTGQVGIGTTSPTSGTALDLGSNTTTSNSSLLLPVGTTGTRPTTGINGMIRYNSTTPAVEAYVGGSWTALGGGSITGSGTTNYVARWTSSTALGTGELYDTGSLVSVGTTSTGSMLGIYGGVSIGTSYVGTAAPTNGAIIQGSVGIGTASPVFPLSIYGSLMSSPYAQFGITNTAIAGYTQMEYNGTGHSYFTGVGNASESAFGVANKYYIGDATLNVMRVVVDTSGNVGIGTTAPAAPFDLTSQLSGGYIARMRNTSAAGFSELDFFDSGNVDQGAVGWANTSASPVSNVFYAGSNGNYPMQLITNSAARLYITAGGNVGIGTTSPAAILDVETTAYPASSNLFRVANGNGFSIQADAYGNLAFLNNAYSISYDGTHEAFSGNNGEPLVLETDVLGGSNDNIDLLPNGTGKVGIGTTSPQYLFQVVGTPAGNGAENDLAAFVHTAADEGVIAGYYESGAGGTPLYSFVRSSGGIPFGLGTSSSNTTIYITTAGSVGIGTTSPQATLDVAGTAHLTKNSSAPYACSSTYDGNIALTAVYTLCVCKGSSSAWYLTSNGTTACTW